MSTPVILAVDPSIRELGWAIQTTKPYNFYRGCISIPQGLLLPEVLGGIGERIPVDKFGKITELVVEYPEFFQGSQKGAVAAVNGTTFGLAAIAGYLQGFYGLTHRQVFHYRPSEWKGQIPKAGMMYRFKRRFGYSATNDHEAEAALLLDFHLKKYGRTSL